MNTLVCMPIWNEDPMVLKTVIKYSIESTDFDFVLCDDGSKNQEEIITCLQTLSIQYPGRIVEILSHKENGGQGFTLKKLVRWGIDNGYKYFVTMDSDGQHRIEDVKVMHAELINKGYNIIIGSRFKTREAKKISTV